VIHATLAFESQRQTGRIPQAALVVHLRTGDVIFAGDGVAVDDALVVYLADGSRIADGGTFAGLAGEIVYRGRLLELGRLEEGDDDAEGFAAMPSRRGSFTATLDNADGLISQLMLTVPLVGNDASLAFSFPGLDVDDRLFRFRAEIARVEISDERVTLEQRTA
jgi:hypothetical protein